MKKVLFSILATVFAIWCVTTTTSCTNEYKDMIPGEVRLIENDYRNDDEIHDIQYTTDAGTTTMSAMEVRALWHAAIIGAENSFAKNANGEANLYDSPVKAEDAFFVHLRQSMSVIAEKYPYAYDAVIQELVRAEVHTYVEYVWCAMAEEYINLEFDATPQSATPMVAQ